LALGRQYSAVEARPFRNRRASAQNTDLRRFLVAYVPDWSRSDQETARALVNIAPARSMHRNTGQ
jgi:hypothetical protein